MEILAIIVFLAAASNFFLGFFVFFKDPSKRINRLFGIAGFITAIWVFTNLMMGVKQTLFWLKSSSAFGALVPVIILFWVWELCGIKLTKLRIFLPLSLGLLFLVVSYIYGLIVTNVKRVYLGGFEGETGSLFDFWLIYMFGILAFILYTLISQYLRSQGVKRMQLGYVLIGLFLYISVVLIVSFILPLFGILKFTALDSFSSLFLIFFTTLAITRYHLFEIRVILTELLVGVMGIILVVLPFLMPTAFLRNLTTIIFILFCIFGYLLIKATYQEIKRREEIETLSDELKISNIRLNAALKDLEKSYKKLKELDEAKTQFLSIASHQLRTPLSVIKGYLSMALSRKYGKIEEKPRSFLENVYESTERLIRLVNDFLSISRFQMGAIKFEFEKLQIEEIIESVVNEFDTIAKNKKLYLNFKKPSRKLPPVKVDAQKIRQVILNFIDNAIKYTDKGGINIKIKNQISKIKNDPAGSRFQRQKESTIQIIVEDTGIGISKEGLDKLFKMFSRGETASLISPSGVGIGLYITKEIVNAHKGKVWAESEGEGKGSRFIVELPIAHE